MTGNVNRIKKEMKNGGVPDDMIDLVNTILRYAGTKSRGPGLYGVGNKDIMSKMTKTFFTSVQGVSNVYAQHVPVLIETLEAIMKGKLRTESHPYLTNFFYMVNQHIYFIIPPTTEKILKYFAQCCNNLGMYTTSSFCF